MILVTTPSPALTCTDDVTDWIFLLNGLVVNPAGTRPADVVLRDGRVDAVFPRRTATPESYTTVARDLLHFHDPALARVVAKYVAGVPREGRNSREARARVVNCRDQYLFPGLVDLHEHFRDFEQADKETFETGTRAAIRGGITAALAMPNTRPPATTPDRVARWMDRARGTAFTDVGFWSGVQCPLDPAGCARLLDLGVAGVKIFPHKPLGGCDWTQAASWATIVKALVQQGKTLVVHPDYPRPPDWHRGRFDAALAAGASPLAAHDHAYPVSDEVASVELVRRMLDAAGVPAEAVRVHFLHVSSQPGLEALQELQRAYPGVTIEACPHHLLLSVEELDADPPAWGKVLPPVRSKADHLDYPGVLESGHVTTVGTDHAPHALVEKARPFWEAPSGFPGNELLLPLLVTEAFRGRIALPTIATHCCQNPARLLALHDRERIARGARGDVVVVERCDPYHPDPATFETKAHYSPYASTELLARVTAVFLRGFPVVVDHAVVDPPRGEILLFPPPKARR